MAVIRLLLLAYIIAMVLVVVLSWFPLAPGSPGERVFISLRRLTDPVLVPLRRVLPPVGGVIDLTPTIVLFVLLLIYGALGSS